MDDPRDRRLGDDLYTLYLAALGWMILPMYGEGLGTVLPSDWDDLDRAVAVVASGAVASSVVFGARGAPLLLPRSSVLLQLTSGRSHRSMLQRRVARQAVAAAAIAAIVVTFLLAISSQEIFGYGAAIRVSLVTIAAALIFVPVTTAWLVVFKGDPPRRPALAAGAVVPPALVVAAALGPGLFSATGAAALGAGVVLAGGLGWWALEWVPVDHLWRRAGALDAMRSAARTFDFHRVLVSLVRADAGRRHAARPMPALPAVPAVVWRHLAGLRHGLGVRLVQIALAVAAAVTLLRVGDPSDGVIALATTFAGFAVGMQLSGPVASTVGRVDLSIHYPKGSGPVLRRQAAIVVVLAAVVAVPLALAALPGAERSVTNAIALLFGFGVLAATLQARLGSPDLAAEATKGPPEFLGILLWGRALFGVVLCLVMTITVARAWLRPELAGGIWPSVVPVLLGFTWLQTTKPLEGAHR